MKKIISLFLFFILIFSGCLEDEEQSSSFKDYTITAKVYNSGTSQRVSNVKVKIGAKDTGYSAGFDQGCPNLGTYVVNSNGEAKYTCDNYVGAPSICNVEVFDLAGNYIESSHMYSSNTQVVSVFVD